MDLTQVRALVEAVAMDIQPFGQIRVMNHVSSDPEKQKEWSVHWMKQGFEGIFMHIKYFSLMHGNVKECTPPEWKGLTGLFPFYTY